jgi:hypothetical protein
MTLLVTGASDITHVVHGATETPLSRGTAEEAKREPEAENPGRIIEVNVMGTAAVLDWTGLRRNVARAHDRPVDGGDARAASAVVSLITTEKFRDCLLCNNISCG